MDKGPAYFEIQVDDTTRAIDFYTNVFGWKFTKADGMDTPYWRIETGSSRGGLFQRPMPKAPGPVGINAFCCSMEVANFDATAAKITSNGGITALPKFPVPGTCWQGYFLDTEKNLFGIFQVDENAGK